MVVAVMDQESSMETELQKYANETGMDISVCHFPPCTSKWNK